VGEEVDKEDCEARKNQAMQFREQGQPHASLEKCVDCIKMTEGDNMKKTTETPADPSALICSHCKRGPGAIASRWIQKRGMHQSCYQNLEMKKKRPKKAKPASKPAVKPPKKPPKETNTFNVGDIVKHRASGKKGIISSIYCEASPKLSYICEVKLPISLCAYKNDKSICKPKRNGFYTVNIDFNISIEIHEKFIEKANANKTRR
jgi:hypothetical protein